jgi:hypothetical protein
MATNVTIIHAQDFVRSTPDGLLDLATSTKGLKDIATASAPLAEYKILLDTRHALVKMSITDLWYLAAELGNLGTAFLQKTAVLCPVGDFDQAGFFALCANNRGYPINAFTSFEDAIEWLITK